MQLAMFFE